MIVLISGCDLIHPEDPVDISDELDLVVFGCPIYQKKEITGL